MKDGALRAEGGVVAPGEGGVLLCDEEGEVEVSEIESSTAVRGAAGDCADKVSVVAAVRESAVVTEASSAVAVLASAKAAKEG